jgi:dolichol-phosphate mannosyltransferase
MTVRLLAGYQSKPSYFFGKLALWGFLASFLMLAWTAWNKFANHIYVKDQPLFLIATVVGLAAFQILLIGLLAELIMRSYFESQGKRHYVVREIYRGRSPEA